MPTDWNSYCVRQIHAETSRFLTEQACALLDVQQPEASKGQPTEASASPARVPIPAL